jgi:hypothetical protein
MEQKYEVGGILAKYNFGFLCYVVFSFGRLPPQLYSALQFKQAAPGYHCNSSWWRIAYAIGSGVSHTPLVVAYRIRH